MVYSKVLASTSIILYRKSLVVGGVGVCGEEIIPMFSLVGTVEFVCHFLIGPIWRKEHFCLAHFQVTNEFCIIKFGGDPI